MPFTVNLSGTAQVDDSLITAYDQAFLVAYGQDNVMDQFVQYRQEIGAKAIELPRFSRLGLATTPLDEVEDVTSSALSDTKVVLTPQEYGNVVTTTKLANLQTGGKADLAAAQLVGINWAQTMDKLAILALDQSTNVRVVGGKAEGSVLATDVADRSFLNFMYNKLARANVPMIDGMYVAVLHDDVIHDLREGSGAASWTDVSKYATPENVLRNEVGMYAGFRIIRDNQATFGDQTGAGTVDLYNGYFFGFNALGKATSSPGRLVASGPFDKLGRFVNLGWHEASAYKIIEQDAIWVGKCASSVGANA